MNKRVYITEYVFALPGFSGRSDIREALQGSGSIFSNSTETPSFGKLSFTDDQLALINKQDMKTMREDALAAGICSSLLMGQLDLSPEEKREIPLFVASGIVIEKLFSKRPKVLKYFNEALLMEPVEKKNDRMVRIIPPLMALETLTNAAETYAAQYGGMAGENTTFGACSAGGYYSLKEGYYQILTGRAERAVVGAVNLSGVNSYRSFKPFFKAVDFWRESQCAVFLMLESENSVEARRGTVICEIDKIRALHTVPSLYHQEVKSFRDFFGDELPPLSVVFSGAFFDEDYRHDLEDCVNIVPDAFSWYSSFGNLGAASVLMNVLAASSMLNSHKTETIQCLDRDPYGRMTQVGIKR